MKFLLEKFMADYYPSEIARLVLGYLKEANCPKAWETFLIESGDLQEHYRLLQSGRSCSTNIEGKSLLEILHEYRCLKDAAERNARNNANLNAYSGSSNINLNASHSGSHSSNLNPNISHSGPSSSNVNPNVSCSENFKTPQKNNAEAFNRFKIQQATQSQATVRFAQAGNRSPRLQAFLSTPTRSYSSRTPTRLQGVCVTTLNFGTSAERNDGSASVHISDTPKRHTYARTPVRETIKAQRLCYSEPMKRKPAMSSTMVQTDNQHTYQEVENRNDQPSSDSSSHQRQSEGLSSENSNQFTSSVNSTNYNEGQLQSNNEDRTSSGRTNMEENVNNSLSLLPVNTTTNTAVVNQTIVFTSTEIRTGGDNESSSTPQYDFEAPPYARAPATDSPRLILSLDRSQVTSLTTPMKDRRQWHEEFASPRRKGTIPRRRLLSESPHPKQINTNESSFASIHENVESIIEELMANQHLTQRLADNINKVISEDPEASNSASFPTLQDIQNSDVMIQNIIARAETDSLFNDIISLFGNSRDCDDLNMQESAALTEGEFSINEGTQTNKDESEKAPINEALSSKDETDSVMNNDGTQEKNNEVNSTSETSSQPLASSQLDPVISEAATDQNTPATTNIEVPEPMQVDNDKSNLTQESGSKDVLSSCMSIIQPNDETQMQSCNFEQSGDALNNVQSATSNANESSPLVSASVAENITRLDDASALKPVSIGTPLQVGTQIGVSQAMGGSTQTLSTNQTILCYPSSSLMNNTMSFIPSNPILPAVQNQSFILNPNFQTSPLLQFSYSPNPSFPVQPLDAFQSKLLVVSQPCAKHASNWTNNNLTNDVIIPVQTSPVQTAPVENVAQLPLANSSPFKIPYDYSPSKSFLADNVGKFVTVMSETAPKNKKAERKKSSKFRSSVKDSASSTKDTSSAKNSQSSRKKQGRNKPRRPRKKLRPLFSSPKDPDDPDPSTVNEISDNIPVLSIPDPSPNKDESMSAMEMLNSISEGKNLQSPLLKAVISSAKILAEKGSRLNSTHVRTLEFSSSQSEEGNKLKQFHNSAEGVGRRSSPRLKQKTSCKSPCCSPLKSSESAICNKGNNMTKEKVDVTSNLVSNTIEKLNANKAVSSSMSNVVLSAMQTALKTRPVKTKKQDPSAAIDLFQRAGMSLSPLSPVQKTPLKSPSTGKKITVSRDQYFPDSSSDSDSESDNIPLSAIVASKLNSTLKINETKSPLKQNKSRKSNVEKDTDKNIVKDMPPAPKLMANKNSEVFIADPLKAKSSILSKTAAEKSNSIEDSDAPVNISKLVSPNNDNKSPRKGSDSTRGKSKALDPVQRGSSKESKEAKNIEPAQSCSEMAGNSPVHPIILESDEDGEVPKIRNENVASGVVSTTESKSSKKERKEKHKKKKHGQNLTSPSKEKTFNREKSKRKSSPLSQKSNSPRIRKTSEHLLQNEKPDSPTVKNDCNAPKKGCTEKKKQIFSNKKSDSENSDLSQKLRETANINEIDNHSVLNEEANVPPPKSYGRTQNSPVAKIKDRQKGNFYISSPLKEKEACNPSTLEKNPNSFSGMKKNKKIDELCDKLRNAVENSPRKEGTLKPMTEVDKLPDTMVTNPFKVPTNETLLEKDPATKKMASVNPVENEAIKLASIDIPGEMNSTINTNVRNDIALDCQENINSKQSNIGKEPVKLNVKKRVLPPPKKRIRPVPVPSPHDSSFSLFSPFSSPAHSCFDSTVKSKEKSSISKNLSDSDIMPSPAHCFDSTVKSKEKSSISKNLSDSDIMPSPAHEASLDLTSKPKETPLAINTPDINIDETDTPVPELSFPKNVSFGSPTKKKEMPLSPVIRGTRRKFSLGKPKSMAEFYKSALPDRDSDLPISPDPMSSSSCTIETLAGKNLPSADVCITPNKENNHVNKTSPKKKETKKLSQKRKLSSTSIKDSSNEEGLIRSPPKSVNIIENIVDTNTAPESAALLSSQAQMKDLHSSSLYLRTANITENITETNTAPESAELLSSSQVQIEDVNLSSSYLRTEDIIENIANTNTAPESAALLSSSQAQTKDLHSSSFLRTENIRENVSDTNTAPKSSALFSSSQIQMKDVHLSSSDEEGLIKSPIKDSSSEQKCDRTSSQPEKKRKLSTGFSPHHETFTSNVSDRKKANETDNSFSRPDKTIGKHSREILPVHSSTPLNKAKLKSSLKRNADSSVIPAGVKIPSKWNNSKINNYSSTISRSENEMGSKAPRKSRPKIKVVGIISPPKRKIEYSSGHRFRTNPYKTLYSERQARRLLVENRRSPFRQSPNVNNCRSSAHRHKNDKKHSIPDYNYSEKEISFSKEKTTRDYSRKRHEHKDIPSKSSTSDCQEDGSRKCLSPSKSSKSRNRPTSKHESSFSSSKVSEKHFESHDSSNRHRERERVILPEKSNFAIENHDKLTNKNIEVPGKLKSDNFHSESRQELQLKNPSQINFIEQNKQVCEEELDLKNKIVDEATGGISRTSSDQNELDEAVAFLTGDGVPESQEPVISSQSKVNGIKDTDASDNSSEGFADTVVKQLSQAAGLSVPMQIEDISHLLDKIKELGLDNIAGFFGRKK